MELRDSRPKTKRERGKGDTFPTRQKDGQQRSKGERVQGNSVCTT